jgi:hypothetical protein
MNPQQHQRGAAAGDNLLFYEPHQVGAMVVSGVKRFASRHPLSPAGFVAGWLVLLLVMERHFWLIHNNLSSTIKL